MSVIDQKDQKALAWLLEPEDIGVRYLAMRDLVRLPQDDMELIRARQAAVSDGPISQVLDAMDPEGWWEKPGPGYNPKYRSSVWAMILLDQMGASIHDDARIQKACAYMLDHSLSKYGQFSYSGAPGGTFDCLQGNLCKALFDIGAEDERLMKAFDWMARTVTGDGIAPASEKTSPIRYYAYKCGPGFACGANYGSACAWGAVKVMLAFGSLPRETWTPAIQKAVSQGLDFLLSVDPATAAYPTGNSDKPNRSWWKFGFPVFYVTDILLLAEAVLKTSAVYDARLDHAIEFIRSQQDEQGVWHLEYDYSGKTWLEFGKKRTPNKWVTLRALKVLELAGKTRLKM